MPNYVTNKIIISGDEKVIEKMLNEIKNKTEDGETLIDFNKIIPMPEELNITEGSIMDDATNAYLSAINPNNTAFDHEKVSIHELRTMINVVKQFKPESVKTNCLPEEFTNCCNGQKKTIKDIINLGHQYILNTLTYGYPTWYKWCKDNWGTKWNALNAKISEFQNKDTLPEMHDGEDCIPLLKSDTKAIQLIFDTAWSAPSPVITRLASLYKELNFVHGWANEDFGYGVGMAIYENGKITHLIIPKIRCTAAIEMAAVVTDSDLKNDMNLSWDEDAQEYTSIDDEY